MPEIKNIYIMKLCLSYNNFVYYENLLSFARSNKTN